ncbi:MAG: recombinase family protein, partial [Halobacteriovoraceae bacterium]|nr:recombinase family protein [Halobacteriovoraceae bacterium]
MRKKKESKGLRGKSSALWRTQEKGREAVSNLAEKIQPEEFQLQFGPYIRLSPTNEEREEGSLVSHPQRIEDFVRFKNEQMGGQWGQIVDWYVDKDYSGKNLNRPAFQRLCTDIEEGRVNAVIVTELSRLSRSVKDFCQVWDFFQEYNVKFFSLKENFDTSTPMGELMLIQAMSFAQFERHSIVDRIKRGAKARADRGLATGTPPLGYDVVPNRPNHRQV